MKYRYYINDIEVFPQGEWSISYQRNEGQIFFRRILDGELTFIGVDYTFIKGLDCEIATFDIYCGGTVFWEGQFQYPYKAKFDDDSCTVVLTPEVVDEYSCVMNKYQKKLSLRPSTAGIFPELWSCPAPGANVHTFTNFCYPLIGNGAITGDWFSIMLFWTSTLNCAGFDIASSFMLRDDFANGDNYAAAYGTNNYITGATNRLEYVYLSENTHIRSDFGGTECDSTREYTFKMFEDLLRNAFNAYWFFDENGDFRVEHISYFDPSFAHSDYTVGIDLNTVMDRSGRSFAYRRNKYEYETGRMYDQERWSWQHWEGTEATEPHGQDFEGVPVFYGATVGQKSDYVPGDFKEKEIASPQFWADIQWAFDAWDTGGAIDFLDCPTGFCMLDVVVGGDNKIHCDVGVLSTASVANGHLSTANLQDYYHQYNRIFINGNMNSGDVTTFQTAQKHKLQEEIEFPLCCDEGFDPLDRIRTGLGDGEVKGATQKVNSLEVELWYEFDC